MAGRLDNYERWSAEITLGTGDTTKTLLARRRAHAKRSS
jgi:hypothetical protein